MEENKSCGSDGCNEQAIYQGYITRDDAINEIGMQYRCEGHILELHSCEFIEGVY